MAAISPAPTSGPNLEENLLADDDSDAKSLLSLKSYPKFWYNFLLACATGFWVTIFFVPVCNTWWENWLFMDVNLPARLHSPDLQSYWPNVVQMIVFTVYFSTGSTVKLAWQGCAGTLAASLNHFFLSLCFPEGGLCKGCRGGLMNATTGSVIEGCQWKESTGHGWRGQCVEYQDPNWEWGQWFVWADVLGFILMVLSSHANDNAIKFSLSWHITYSMAFMAPVGWIFSRSVEFTSIAGSILAIIITLVPLPQIVTPSIETDPDNIVNALMGISETSWEYMRGSCRLSRHASTSMRYTLEERIGSFDGIVKKALTNLDLSWWETFDLGKYGSLRARLVAFSKCFDDASGGLDDILYTLKMAIAEDSHHFFAALSDAEKGEVSAIRCDAALDNAVRSLQTHSKDLMNYLASDYCIQGRKIDIAKARQVRESAVHLLEVYQSTLQKSAEAQMSLQTLQVNHMAQRGTQSTGLASANPSHVISGPPSGRQSFIPSIASAPLTPTSASLPTSNTSLTGAPLRTAVLSRPGGGMPQSTHNVSLPRGGPVLARTPGSHAFSNAPFRPLPGGLNGHGLQTQGLPQRVYPSYPGGSAAATGTTVTPAPSPATSLQVAPQTLPDSQVFQGQKLRQQGAQGTSASKGLESFERVQLRTNLNTFIFAQVALADKVVQFAESTTHRDKQKKTTLSSEMMQALRDTFWFLHAKEKKDLPPDLQQQEAQKAKISFVYRNFITIGLTTVAQTLLDGDVFTPYSVTMSSTLAVLITTSPGSAVHKNLMRLLGVTLGKVLPIIIMAFVVIWKHSYPSVAHLILTFMYMTYFTYMYHASKEWGFVGCLIAGFGCYTLAGTTVSIRVGSSVFEARYQEIGQVTAAILFQFIVDAIDNLLVGGFPRDRIYATMQKFCYDGTTQTYGSIVQGFQAFFDGDLAKMKAMAEEAKQRLASEEKLLEECDQKTVLTPGIRLPFRYPLMKDVIKQIKGLLSEMDVLILVKLHVNEKLDSGPGAKHTIPSAFLGNATAHKNEDGVVIGDFDDPSEWASILGEEEELMALMKRTLRLLMVVLDHNHEGVIKLHDDLVPTGHEKLGTTKDAPKKSTRVSVLWRSINSAYKATSEIEHLCIAQGIFK